MDQLEFFRKAIGIIRASGLEYMVVGSYASGFWGEPRATYDVDLVVEISESDVPMLESLFPPKEFYMSADAARQAIRQKGQFNIIHPASGNKIDVMVHSGDVLAKTQLSRRRILMVAPGSEAYVASPEDIILGKLRYYREGGSEKHLRDIAGIMKAQADKLDIAYVDDWSTRLGISDDWQRLRPPALA